MSEVLKSTLDYKSKSAVENVKRMTDLVAQISSYEEQIKFGGGEKNIKKQHEKNRLTACDRDSPKGGKLLLRGRGVTNLPSSRR